MASAANILRAAWLESGTNDWRDIDWRPVTLCVSHIRKSQLVLHVLANPRCKCGCVTLKQKQKSKLGYYLQKYLITVSFFQSISPPYFFKLIFMEAILLMELLVMKFIDDAWHRVQLLWSVLSEKGAKKQAGKGQNAGCHWNWCRSNRKFRE